MKRSPPSLLLRLYNTGYTTQINMQEEAIQSKWTSRLLRLWFTHTKNEWLREKKNGKRERNSSKIICFFFFLLRLSLCQSSTFLRQNLQSLVSTVLNCYPPITLSTDAPSYRQLVCCIFPLIFHISLWRYIIPDDCLSVMVYDEKCSGLLMWDVSVYHFDGWPPW